MLLLSAVVIVVVVVVVVAIIVVTVTLVTVTVVVIVDDYGEGRLREMRVLVTPLSYAGPRRSLSSSVTNVSAVHRSQRYDATFHV